MGLSIDIISYKKITQGLRITNGLIELVAGLDFGPRILHFSDIDAENMFFVDEKQLLSAKNDEHFRVYGGHRLWTAPEKKGQTYAPDNTTVNWFERGNKVTLQQPASNKYPLTKEIEIEMDAEQPVVRLKHRIVNEGDWDLHLAPWALTVMAPGGQAILPLPKRESHDENLLPNGSLVFWAYTNFADSRWRYGFEFLRVQHDPSQKTLLKFGLAAESGWLAYVNKQTLFAKQTKIIADANYPDRGTPYQIYLDKKIIELECLGPLEKIEPGQSLFLEEIWVLKSNVFLPQNDNDVKKNILPNLENHFNLA